MRRLACVACLVLLAACSTTPPAPFPEPGASSPKAAFRLEDPTQASEIVLYALGLVDTGYKFGGSNPDAGLDCSGMVSYVVAQVSGRRLPHNAAQIANLTRPIPRADLRPADLVFFNTDGSPYSHMGIYLGDGKFVHAPSSKGRVRVERMDNVYFSRRYVGARSLF